MTEPIVARSGTRSITANRKGQGWSVGLRLLLVIGGGYVASSALVAGLARALPSLGLARIDGVVLASMLGFVIYLAVLILGFARQRLLRVAVDLLVIAGLGLMLAALTGA
ncbi:hypothetical protein [Tardiphaga sp.]|uniref:hypothetical protein n=1 Tax=Tardiphaga sp. TaxID=1926292 RepID=UPI00262E7D54|nr:hypothetical protein [Tardiphaga sp.]MDB5619892.1 hypothetical protein [Tardiphaga sp.]